MGLKQFEDSSEKDLPIPAIGTSWRSKKDNGVSRITYRVNEVYNVGSTDPDLPPVVSYTALSGLKGCMHVKGWHENMVYIKTYDSEINIVMDFADKYANASNSYAGPDARTRLLRSVESLVYNITIPH